jgi:hypothetical protein
MCMWGWVGVVMSKAGNLLFQPWLASSTCVPHSPPKRQGGCQASLKIMALRC